ncbi:MAG: hypothetical protein ACREIP_18470 [Alphaproteobacteria bacterium]
MMQAAPVVPMSAPIEPKTYREFFDPSSSKTAPSEAIPSVATPASAAKAINDQNGNPGLMPFSLGLRFFCWRSLM